MKHHSLETEKMIRFTSLSSITYRVELLECKLLEVYAFLPKLVSDFRLRSLMLMAQPQAAEKKKISILNVRHLENKGNNTPSYTKSGNPEKQRDAPLLTGRHPGSQKQLKNPMYLNIK